VNKGKQFWLDSWQQGRIPFHKNEVHPDLRSFWPAMSIQPKSTVLVPLCGKSLDLLWIAQQGHQVIGIELSEQAVVQFFKEQGLDFRIESYHGVTRYNADSLSVWVSDIFDLDSALIPKIDVLYDRAALVALPQKLRRTYADLCFHWLKSQGSILLNTLSYEHKELLGPPYSVSAEEVADLYKAAALRCLRAEKNEKSINSSNGEEYCVVVEESVWWITKNGIKIERSCRLPVLQDPIPF
jgi:thiopurine S-methyltransferase